MSTDVTPLRRNRDFLLLWSGSAVSGLGSNATNVAYPLLVLALTGSPFAAGLTGFVALLPQLLFQLPAGALVDRLNRRLVMIWCDLLRGMAIGSIVVALLIHQLHLPQILVVGFVECTLSVCYRLAASAAVPNVVHRSQLTAAFARNEARTRGAAMAGQPLGGVLFGLGRAIPFLFDALSYVVSLVTLLLIRKEFQAARSHGRKRGELTEGIRWLWRQPFLRTTAFLVSGSNLLFQALFLTVIVITRDHGASPSAIGLMFGMTACGGMVGSLVAPVLRRRVSMKAVVIGVNWVWAVLTPLVLVAPNPYLIGTAYAMMSFAGPLWNVAIAAYELAITPDRIRGRVLAASGIVAAGAVPAGSLIGGLLLDRVGTTTTGVILVAWMALLAISASVSPAVRGAPELATETEPPHHDAKRAVPPPVTQPVPAVPQPSAPTPTATPT
jgi:MFS family permease